MPKLKFIKKEKTKGVHIYMSNATKGKVLELMQKYHVSTSTIIDIACKCLYPCDLLCNVRHDKDAKYRSWYKPKYFTEQPRPTSQEETIYGTNCLYIAVNHFQLWKELANNKIDNNKIYNQFLAELSKKRDIYWDYNAQLRTQWRAKKELAKYGS